MSYTLIFKVTLSKAGGGGSHTPQTVQPSITVSFLSNLLKKEEMLPAARCKMRT